MPYTPLPKPPDSRELLDELAASTQHWSIKEKEVERENRSRNTQFYAGPTLVTPHHDFTYQAHEHILPPQHEYYSTAPPSCQPTFPFVNHQGGYNSWNQHCSNYGISQYSNSYFPQPPNPSKRPLESILHNVATSGTPQEHFQDKFTQLNTPCEESEEYSGYPLRMPDPSDYISNNSLPSFPTVTNPYHTPEYEQAHFMAFPDPKDYQTSWVEVDPHNPVLLPIVREGLFYHFQSKHNITPANEYFNCFSGHELVDVICDVLNGASRKTALSVGLVLQEHAVFRHVSSDNRSLMDNDQEFYKLCITDTEENPREDPLVASKSSQEVESLPAPVAIQHLSPTQQAVNDQPSEIPLYTSTNVSRKPTELIRQSTNEYESLWISSVSKETVEALNDKEKNRQIAIFEIVYTEEEYLRDLKLYDSLFIEPLRASRIFSSEKIENFIQDVFINYRDLQQLHEEMLSVLKERQIGKTSVEMIGDVMIQFIEKLEPYIQFSVGSINSAHTLKIERTHSSALESFLEECQSKPEARKLPLESFLSRPTSRIARYPLLLDRVLKYTPESSVDRQMLVSSIDSIKELLNKLNEEMGRAENRLKLQEIEDKIEFKSEDYMDLKLNETDRQLIREGVLKRTIGQSLRLILFDHALLLAKDKKSFATSNITYRVYARPIPLEFLSLQAHTDDGAITDEDPTKTTYSFSIVNLSKWGGTYTLIASSFAERKQWLDKIQEQQAKHMFKQLRIFDLASVSDHQFTLESSVRCCNPYYTRDGKRKIVIGTTDGLYSGFEGDPASFSKVLPLEQVRQVEVLEEIRMVIVLQDKLLLSYSIDLLDHPSSWANRHGQKLASQVSYFSAGHCDGKLLVVVVRLKGLKSFFKVLEPVSLRDTPKIKGKLLCQRNGFALRLFKEFYIGAESYSVQFLTKKLYVVCPKGFEIVNLEALHLNKSIPDFNDEVQFGFINKRENCKPLAMFPLSSQEFLICYNGFAFHLDNLGRRTRPNLLIEWEGQPAYVALYGHYIIAFDPSFMEIRDAESGELIQIIQGYNLRYLNPGTHKDSIYLAMEPLRKHEQYVFRIVTTCPVTDHPSFSTDPLIRKISEERISEF